MSFVLISNKIFLLIIIIPIIFINSKSSTSIAQSFINENVVAEGTVTHSFGINTMEISYHSGYLLKNLNWIISPGEPKAKVFIEPDSLAKNFQDKKVHVEGFFTQVPGEKINSHSFTATYYVILVDTIYTIK